MNNGRKIPTIDDLIALPEPNDAQISPDGRFVTYTLTKPDFDNNEYLSQIWLVANEENVTPRQLTFANQSSQSPRSTATSPLPMKLSSTNNAWPFISPETSTNVAVPLCTFRGNKVVTYGGV